MSELPVGEIVLGDSLLVLSTFPANSIDLIVSDPPYGLALHKANAVGGSQITKKKTIKGGFMGHKWDAEVPSVEIWKECFRVLKHGAFAFIMCAARQDSLAKLIVRLEQAGFQTNFSSIYWAYASGFPKALNMSKAVDRRLGIKEVVGKASNQIHLANIGEAGYKAEWDETVPCSDEAKDLDGSYAGFQPKPAVEIIVVVMKPLDENTFVDQAMKDKKGVTWMDDCKIPYANLLVSDEATGRFPANLLVSDDVLNDGTVTKSSTLQQPEEKVGDKNRWKDGGWKEMGNVRGYDDSGSFSRYFDVDKWWEEQIKTLPKEVQEVFPFLIVPKADKGEKDQGCKELPKKKVLPYTKGGFANPKTDETEVAPRANIHPTVKPIGLMSYLITLGSRKGDIVLDPFVGSGTTCLAAKLLERQFIGIDITQEYVDIARAKLGYLGKIGVEHTFFVRIPYEAK